jgi:hypothetical protein
MTTPLQGCFRQSVTGKLYKLQERQPVKKWWTKLAPGGRRLPTFRSNLLTSSSGSKYKKGHGSSNKLSSFWIYLSFGGLGATLQRQRCRQDITPINVYQTVRHHRIDYSTVCIDCHGTTPSPKSRKWCDLTFFHCLLIGGRTSGDASQLLAYVDCSSLPVCSYFETKDRRERAGALYWKVTENGTSQECWQITRNQYRRWGPMGCLCVCVCVCLNR